MTALPHSIVGFMSDIGVFSLVSMKYMKYMKCFLQAFNRYSGHE